MCLERMIRHNYSTDILHVINTHAGSCEVVLETVIDVDLLVRLKVNSTLRVERSEKLETAFRKVGALRELKKSPSRQVQATRSRNMGLPLPLGERSLRAYVSS